MAGEQAADWSRFAIGASVKAVVHEHKDYGVIVDLVDDPNLVGLIPLHQVRLFPPLTAPFTYTCHLYMDKIKACLMTFYQRNASPLQFKKADQTWSLSQVQVKRGDMRFLL